MARNKGFLLAGPAEISIQRKQLKEIINSLLPACIEPDLDSGAPFKAQAIIANPPAYGEIDANMKYRFLHPSVCVCVCAASGANIYQEI